MSASAWSTNPLVLKHFEKTECVCVCLHWEGDLGVSLLKCVFKDKKKKVSLFTLELVLMRVCVCVSVRAHVSLRSCGSIQCKYLSASTPLDLFLTTEYPTGTLIIPSRNPRLNTLPCGNAWWLVCENTVSDSPRSSLSRCIFAEGALSRPPQSPSSAPCLSRLDKCPQVCREFSWNPRSWRSFAAVSLPGKSFKFGVSDHLMGLSLTKWAVRNSLLTRNTHCRAHRALSRARRRLEVGFRYVGTCTKQRLHYLKIAAHAGVKNLKSHICEERES